MLPEFDFNLINESFVGIVVLALYAGWSIRAKQDKANKEYLRSMMDIYETKLVATEERLNESDKVCQSRVDIVRSDLESLHVRQEREISSIRKAHRDEVDTLKSLVDRLMVRLDQLSK